MVKEIWILQEQEKFQWLGKENCYHRNVCACETKESALAALRELYKQNQNADKHWFNEEETLYIYSYRDSQVNIKKEKWVFVSPCTLM